MTINIKTVTLRRRTGTSGPKSASTSHRARVYIFPEGESILENLSNRRERPFNVYKKEVLPRLWQLLGVDAPTDIGWSQKAGCSCPCSPGFVDKGWELQYDVFVTVTEDAVKTLTIKDERK